MASICLGLNVLIKGVSDTEEKEHKKIADI